MCLSEGCDWIHVALLEMKADSLLATLTQNRISSLKFYFRFKV